MDVISIIDKKRLKNELSYEEIKFIFEGFLNGDVTDYQMSALLMAIVLNGMTDEEIFSLTDIFINSGDILDLSNIDGVIVDKHSTGGIGDKTTLIITPIVASLGVKVCKMSGRGLGYTGGTIDKLESIPGFKVALDDSELIKQVNNIGIALTSQTKNLVPLDKKVYALRDVTATVESIPLIASSIMSKKIASGADKILIDIKVGSGALIKNNKDASYLSELMIKIGKKYNRDVETLITDMNIPLGRAIGNGLEVIEAINILKGNDKESYLYEVCVELASKLISMAFKYDDEKSKSLVIENINNGKAFDKFVDLVNHQGGNLNKLTISSKTMNIRSSYSGIIKNIDALKIGKLAVALGSGVEKKGDQIDYGVGIVLNKNVGDYVKVGDILCTLYIGDRDIFPNPLEAFEIVSI